MSKISRLCLLSLVGFLAFSAQVVISQAPTAISSTPLVPAPTTTSTPVETPVRVLQAQLDQLNKDSTRDTAIIQWGLGTLVVLTLLLLGYNGFRNYRDKEALKGDIIRDNRDRAAKTRSDLRLENQVLIHKTIQEETEREIKPLKTQIASIKYDIMTLESNYWEEKGVMDNVIWKRVKMIELALEHDLGGIPSSLDHIKEAIPHAHSLENIYISDLLSVLARLDPALSTEVDRIRHLIHERREQQAQEKTPSS